ncbi:MAG: ATP-binding protein [Clostridia bacterium]|nr:ATP-binding protein [Clostridia bacterium]
MIVREKYLKVIRGFYDSDLVKVITGVRRCGKSVILKMIIDEIATKTDNIIYLNFEKTSDFAMASNVSELIQYVKNNRKEGKCYCFFDEIQEIDNWQVAIKDLRLDNCSIFITGSNSKLLSSEISTLLSGRFVSFRIRPFVYKEISEYGKEFDVDVSVTDYLIWGGFPGRFENTSLEGTKAYLSDLENTIVVNDLIKRYKIRKVVAFKKVVNYVLRSNSRIFSIRSIHKYMKNDFPDLAMSTVTRFMECLKEAYIIDEIPQYSTKTKQELQFYGKIYNCDVGFNSLRANNYRYDLDHNLENIVYNELLYMGYELKVFVNNGKEIDFLASKDNKVFLVQVAYSVADEKAYEREMGAFDKVDNRNQKILITNDIIDYSTSVVKHIRFEDFLKMEEL